MFFSVVVHHFCFMIAPAVAQEPIWLEKRARAEVMMTVLKLTVRPLQSATSVIQYQADVEYVRCRFAE